MDPFRFALAAVPLAAYCALLGLINLRRKPLVTSGASDLAVLGVALTGAVWIGPLELFRPQAATAEFGNYIWPILIAFYWLWVSLAVLTARPRLVVYNTSTEELRPVLVEAVAPLDPTARWAGDSLLLPRLGVQLHLDEFSLMRNVSLVSTGGDQNLESWRRLASALRRGMGSLRVRPNPRAAGFLIVALLLFGGCVAHLINHPQELAAAIRQVFAYGAA
ncbi:MAG: hypothetical protein WD851_14260 [Pirellulales bacterium]